MVSIMLLGFPEGAVMPNLVFLNISWYNIEPSKCCLEDDDDDDDDDALANGHGGRLLQQQHHHLQDGNSSSSITISNSITILYLQILVQRQRLGCVRG